jgi:hypothetical protein
MAELHDLRAWTTPKTTRPNELARKGISLFHGALGQTGHDLPYQVLSAVPQIQPWCSFTALQPGSRLSMRALFVLRVIAVMPRLPFCAISVRCTIMRYVTDLCCDALAFSEPQLKLAVPADVAAPGCRRISPSFSYGCRTYNQSIIHAALGALVAWHGRSRLA